LLVGIREMNNLIPVETIAAKIYLIREQRVLLDRDLAQLYEVETRTLKQSVRRNIRRFPDDFMFELTREEEESLRSQSVILKGRGQHSKYQAFAFTEQGVAMLSSVLKSDRAIEVNIAIMRAFVKMREMLSSSRKFAAKLEELEKRLGEHDENFQIVFDAIKQIITAEDKPRKKIGF
jgi:phage regulator Rha-like protein